MTYKGLGELNNEPTSWPWRLPIAALPSPPPMEGSCQFIFPSKANGLVGRLVSWLGFEPSTSRSHVMWIQVLIQLGDGTQESTESSIKIKMQFLISDRDTKVSRVSSLNVACLDFQLERKKINSASDLQARVLWPSTKSRSVWSASLYHAFC